jgi:16S rRNA (cytosine967-C5)-methyltransferase
VSRYHSYLNSAEEILSHYKAKEPLAAFLKSFFSVNKKYGSTDRKVISHLCYCYFRLGKMKMEMPVEERIMTGLFLCSDQSNEILQALRPDWNNKVSESLNDKLSLIQAENSFENIFSFADELSNGIEKEKFILSHLTQPDVFLRLRPKKEEVVKQKLQDAGIDFKIISDCCLALPAASKMDNVIELDKEAVIQDYSSQRVGEFFVSGQTETVRPSLTVWDCCAGSGGKSIMLYDLYPDIELIVSDVRETILANLKKRFAKAGIRKYKSFIGDLTSGFRLPGSDFDLIIADVPCSGSGTWGRTPEQLYYFEEKKINEYSSLQKKIVSNVIPYLQPGGYLLYVTCSVFKEENEDVVDFIKQNFNLQLIKMETLKGYDKKADTMFATLLKLPQ